MRKTDYLVLKAPIVLFATGGVADPTASGGERSCGSRIGEPARASSVQTESPRVQLLALRSPDRAAHWPERRLPRVRRVLYLVGAIVFVDTMFFAALTPLLPQYAAEFGIGKTGWGSNVRGEPQVRNTLTAISPRFAMRSFSIATERQA